MRGMTRGVARRVRHLFLAGGIGMVLAVPAAQADGACSASPSGLAHSGGVACHAAGGIGHAYGRPAGAGTGHKVG